MQKSTGVPAFPHPEALNFETSTIVAPSTGMTLRDYFAAKALPAMISMCQYADGAWDHATVAQNAYALADAMLEERAP